MKAITMPRIRIWHALSLLQFGGQKIMAIDPTNYTENKSPKGSIVNYVFVGLTVATIITSLLCIAAIIFL